MTLGDEMPIVLWPQGGKLVHQLLEGVTFAYDLYLGCSRDHWKGISKEYNSKIG